MYKNVKVLDVHAHVSAPGPNGMNVLGAILASNTPTQLDPRKPLPRMGFNDQTWAESTKRHVDLLDDHNIDVQILGPRPFAMLGWMQPHLLPSWVRFNNLMIAKQCELHPSRFIGAATLPQLSNAPDLKHCLPELEFCVKELGFQACYLSPDPAGMRTTPGMHTAYWYPVYEECQKLGIPIIVHGTNCLDPRLDVIPQNYQIGFVWEQYLATQVLSHGDVFERFPELKIVVCHCGGALDRFIKSDPHLSQKDRSKNLFFDCNALDLDYLTAAIRQRTPARLCYGCEVPGSGSAVRPETGKMGDDLVPIIAGFDWLSEEDKITIFNRNPLYVCPAFKKFV